MKAIYLNLAAVAAFLAAGPANAQSVRADNAERQQCWFQTDSSRLTGYYDVCPDNRLPEALAPRRPVVTFDPPPPVIGIPPVIAVTDSPRDSGGDSTDGVGGR